MTDSKSKQYPVIFSIEKIENQKPSPSSNQSNSDEIVNYSKDLIDVVDFLSDKKNTPPKTNDFDIKTQEFDTKDTIETIIIPLETDANLYCDENKEKIDNNKPKENNCNNLIENNKQEISQYNELNMNFTFKDSISYKETFDIKSEEEMLCSNLDEIIERNKKSPKFGSKEKKEPEFKILDPSIKIIKKESIEKPKQIDPIINAKITEICKKNSVLLKENNIKTFNNNNNIKKNGTKSIFSKKTTSECGKCHANLKTNKKEEIIQLSCTHRFHIVIFI